MWPLLLAGAALVTALKWWEKIGQGERSRIVQSTIIDMVKQGKGEYEWIHLTPDIMVMSDAFKLNSYRVPVSAKTTATLVQLLSSREPDEYQVVPTTAYVEDLIHEKCNVRVIPPTVDYRIASTDDAVLTFNQGLDSQIAGRSGLVSCVGKSWIVDNSSLLAPGRAVNYGMFRPDGPYASVTGKFRLWQQPGTRHDPMHWDYSQTMRLLRIPRNFSIPSHEPLRTNKLYQ